MTTKHLKLTALLAIPAMALGLHAARAHHAPLVLAHYWKGRAANCTLREAFEGETASRLQAASVETLRQSSRVIKQDERYSLWATPYGEFWAPTASKDALLYDIGEQMRGIYEAGTRVRPGNIVLDAGANVGVYTRKALALGASKVIAIEPAPENLECLRRNFAAEIARGQVVVYPKGIWDRDDTLKLSVDPGDSAKDSFLRPIQGASYVEAPLTTIDKMVAELGLTRVDFIKMDIEGAERKAIMGGRQTIAKYHPHMALCIYHVEGDEVEVPRLALEAYPAYQVSRACFTAQNRVQPEVAFFY